MTHRLCEAFPVTCWKHLATLQSSTGAQPRRTPLLNNFSKDLQKHVITCVVSALDNSTKRPWVLAIKSKAPHFYHFSDARLIISVITAWASTAQGWGLLRGGDLIAHPLESVPLCRVHVLQEMLLSECCWHSHTPSKRHERTRLLLLFLFLLPYFLEPCFSSGNTHLSLTG